MEIKTLFLITLSQLPLILLKWDLIEPLGGVIVKYSNAVGC